MAKDLSDKTAEYRLSSLKLAYDALAPKVFSSARQTELSDLKELFELAEYNDRFINNSEIDIQYKSANEKIREQLREKSPRA